MQQGYCGDVGFYVVVRSVEEEQGETILLLLRDPRVDPNQQVLVVTMILPYMVIFSSNLYPGQCRPLSSPRCRPAPSFTFCRPAPRSQSHRPKYQVTVPSLIDWIGSLVD